MNGIPDVHCVFKGYVFWLELKANPGKNYGVSKYQIVWHLKYRRAGGNAFILNQPFVDRAPKLLAVEEPGVVLPVPHNFIPVPVLDIITWMARWSWRLAPRDRMGKRSSRSRSKPTKLGFFYMTGNPALRRSGKTPLNKSQFSAGFVSHLAGCMDPGVSCIRAWHLVKSCIYIKDN